MSEELADHITVLRRPLTAPKPTHVDPADDVPGLEGLVAPFVVPYEHYKNLVAGIDTFLSSHTLASNHM